jgi:hypothetical protein
MCLVVAAGCGMVTYGGTAVMRAIARRSANPSQGDAAADIDDAPLRRAAEATVAGFLLGANILVTPAVTAVVIRWHQGDSGLDRNAATACGALLVALLLVCATAAAVSAFSQRFVYIPAPQRTARWPDLPHTRRKRFKRWLFHADGEWAASLVRTPARGKLTTDNRRARKFAVTVSTLLECGLLPVFDEFRGTRAWFCLVDAAVQVALGVAGAAAEFTAADSGLVSCAATAWATCAVSAAYVTILLVARPHRYRAQWLAVAVPNVIVLCLALATAGVVQYAVMQRRLPDREVLVGLAVGAQGLAFIQALYDVTVQAQDLVSAWRGRTLWRYLRRRTHSTAARLTAQREVARRDETSYVVPSPETFVPLALIPLRPVTDAHLQLPPVPHAFGPAPVAAPAPLRPPALPVAPSEVSSSTSSDEADDASDDTWRQYEERLRNLLLC